MKRFALKCTMLACLAALAAGCLAACSSAATGVDAAQQDNKSYMSQVNGIMDELGSDLDSFVDAVSRNDLVNMRTQADNAYKALDDLEALEVPDDLADVQKKYVDGSAKLRKALDDYIDLFTEASSGALEQSTYEDRIAVIQKAYDEGVALLKEGDELAAAK